MRTPGDRAVPEFIRTARFEALKRAVSEGRYHINSAAIADRILDEARNNIRAHLAGR